MAFSRRDLEMPSPFVVECRRLMDARLSAVNAAGEDAEWALTYCFQMHRAGRFDEYLALRTEQESRA